MPASRIVLRYSIAEFCYIARQVFAFQVWSSEDPDANYGVFPEFNLNYMVMRNASLEASLLAVRKLDDYFTPVAKKRYPDDIHACDFPRYSGSSFLSGSSRKALNKQLAHPTTDSLLNGRVEWYTDALTLRAAMTSLDFIDYLLRDYRVRTGDERGDVLQTKRYLLEYLDWMAGFERNANSEMWQTYLRYRKRPTARRPHWVNLLRELARKSKSGIGTN